MTISIIVIVSLVALLVGVRKVRCNGNAHLTQIQKVLDPKREHLMVVELGYVSNQPDLIQRRVVAELDQRNLLPTWTTPEQKQNPHLLLSAARLCVNARRTGCTVLS